MRLWLPVLWATLTVSRTWSARVAQDRDDTSSTSTLSFHSNYTYKSTTATYRVAQDSEDNSSTSTLSFHSNYTQKSTTATYQERSYGPGYVVAPGDGHLYLDGELFDFRMLNAPTLIATESEFEVRDLLETIRAFGTPVTRTYTLRVANEMFQGGVMPSSQAHVIGWDENSNDWKYNETVWKQFDVALDLSRSYGVKLIIPIINQDYGSSDSDYVGNFNDLIRHRYKIADYSVANKAVDWYTDRNMIDSFKKLISFLMNRVNTVNGIRYGDDETIMAFETGNELNWGDTNRTSFKRPPPALWTLEIAEHMKSLAPNLLVMDGSYSRNAKNGTTWEKSVLDSEYVDLFSYHLYGNGDVDLYDGLNQEVRAHRKTFIIGEHGFYSNASTYIKAYEKFDCAGALIWSLRGHSEKGGFVTHGEGNNIYSYHAPGWRNQTSKSFDNQEADVIEATYNASYAVLGLAPPPKPIPGTPQIFFITNGTHPGLSWRGAAWAERYQIYGGQFQGVSFKVISEEVQDNVEPGDLFIPLDPRQPTKTLTLPPKVYKPVESQEGWEDTKWCVAGSACYESRTTYTSTEQITFTEKSTTSTRNGTSIEKGSLAQKTLSPGTLNSIQKSKYKVLPLMFPSNRKRGIEGGWYSVRGVNPDGVPGQGSRALYLKSDWMNWSYADK